MPRTDVAARYGVTTDQISEAIRVATIGDISGNLAKFNAGDRLMPIRVQLTEASRGDLDLIEALNLTTAAGGTVPLSAVADVELRAGPVLDRPLRPRAPRHDRRRPRRQCRDRRGAGAGLCLARGEEPAEIRAPPDHRRRRDHGGGLQRLRHGDGRGPADGRGRARAAARQRVPPDHHPAVAAAVARRRRRGLARHQQLACRCRSSSAS